MPPPWRKYRPRPPSRSRSDRPWPWICGESISRASSGGNQRSLSPLEASISSWSSRARSDGVDQSPPTAAGGNRPLPSIGVRSLPVCPQAACSKCLSERSSGEGGTVHSQGFEQLLLRQLGKLVPTDILQKELHYCVPGIRVFELNAWRPHPDHRWNRTIRLVLHKCQHPGVIVARFIHWQRERSDSCAVTEDMAQEHGLGTASDGVGELPR